MAIEIITAVLVLLFTYTGMSKLLHHDEFVHQLVKSPYTEQIASVTAWLLPLTELGVSLLLYIKRTRLAGLYAAFTLMLFFTVYVYSMLHFSYYVPCSCGGVLASLSWTQHFWFNVFFTVLSLTGILLNITANFNRRPFQAF